MDVEIEYRCDHCCASSTLIVALEKEDAPDVNQLVPVAAKWEDDREGSCAECHDPYEVMRSLCPSVWHAAYEDAIEDMWLSHYDHA